MIFNLSKEHKSLFANSILYIITKLILGYISYFFLFILVWLNFIPLLIIFTTIFSGLLENMFFVFAKILAPIIVKFVDIPDTIHYSTENPDQNFPIMKIFFIIYLIFAVTCEFGKFILKKFFHKDIKPLFQSGAHFGMFLVHSIYFLLLVAIILGKNIEGGIGMFIGSLVAYIFNLAALKIYFKIGQWTQKINDNYQKQIQQKTPFGQDFLNDI